MMFSVPILNVVDAGALLIVLACSFEIVRITRVFESFVLSTSNALVCIGAMGWIVWDCTRHEVLLWQFAFHFGIAMYSVRLYRLKMRGQINEDHSRRVNLRATRPTH